MVFTTKIDHFIGSITINKPPVNALSSEDWINFYKLFDDLVFKEDIKVIILNSSGKGFCAGADLNEHENLASKDKLKVSEKINNGVWKSAQAIERSHVPVIVNCSNYVVGAGMLVAMSADFIFAEGHLGNVGDGPGFRGFAGITLERLMKRGLDLPFNVLIGSELFYGSEAAGEGNSTGWAGFGARLDFGF